jgi:hypothetical protein
MGNKHSGDRSMAEMVQIILHRVLKAMRTRYAKGGQMKLESGGQMLRNIHMKPAGQLIAGQTAGF